MFPISRSPSRHALSVGLATLLAGALGLSGCASSPTAAKATPAASTTKAVVTPPPFTVQGVPAALAIIKTLSFGASVPSSPSAAGQSIVLLDANARRMFAGIRDGNLL